MNAIEIKSLTKIYKGRVRALDDLSLNIRKAQIFGIVGSNGAGKSTIMNILAGILDKNNGMVSIFGKQIRSSSHEYKRRVGFVLDKPHYISKLSVKDYLYFCGAMFEIPADETQRRTQDLVHFFDLDEKENTLIDNCSKGMKKKVSLAAALIHQPDLLILDEPFEGIDAASTKIIKDHFRFMVKKGITIVLSSHNLNSVEKLCDEVAIIHKGKLIIQIKTQEISDTVKDEATKETYQSLEEIFIDAVSDNNKKLQSYPGYRGIFFRM